MAGGRALRAKVLLPGPAGLLLAVLLATGCASLTPPPGRGTDLGYTPRGASSPESEAPERLHRRQHSRETLAMAGASKGAVARHSAQGNAWAELLTAAGLDARDEQPVPGGSLTPTQAARLLEVLLRKPVTLGTFPPRMALGHLLREVLAAGEVPWDELLRRVGRFSAVAVLRPDGYLAWARTGHTQQKVAPLEWRDGAFRAHQFELGRFYAGRRGVFQLLDARLQEVDREPLAEVYDDADYLGRTLDGAEAAFVKLALALGQFFTRPLDSLAALRHLPAGIAALIASSPEYFERFRYMTRGEQVQVIAELATNLLVVTGTATATTRTVTGMVAGAEAMVPVLTLSAQGALALQRVAVPVGRVATVLGGGPGAAIILHRANTAAGDASPSGGRGPGEWGPAEEGGMPEGSRAYQAQVTGRSADEAYWVGGLGRRSGGTKFDGFKDGVLLEAKGPGYADKFLDNLDPKYWFEPTGARGLIDQAVRQRKRVQGLGLRIEWHVAEKKAADAIRKLLRREGVEGIEVIHTPPR